VNAPEHSRCGYAAIVGRPNVGKSTLVNALVGEKISIVSSKPHTTRHRILGVLNRGADQLLLIDTPGLAPRGKRVLHRLMSRAIETARNDADVLLVVVDALRVTDEDRALLDSLGSVLERTVVAVNKIDALASRSQLLPLLDGLAKAFPAATWVPVSARTGENLAALVAEIVERLPAGPALFPPDVRTDRDQRFRIAELIREQLMGVLHQEVPYGLAVEVEHLGRNDDGQWLVHGLIWVERDSHKGIVIGKQGHILKEAGRAARAELSRLLGGRVHLELWVKVRAHWADNERELARLGYDLP
jgi:GTP-binding protein Era